MHLKALKILYLYVFYAILEVQGKLIFPAKNLAFGEKTYVQIRPKSSIQTYRF